MDRTEFIVATSIILFIAFLLGWSASWLMHRMTRVTQADMNEIDSMARELHDAEETRDQALAYLEQREAELTSQLSQSEAELRAAMDGLREARQEAADLRDYIGKANAGG
jgi:septal ring factor EnvC (AmiA/AmiB activator)